MNTTKQNDSSEIIIPLVVLILFLLFISWMLYLVLSSTTGINNNYVQLSSKTATIKQGNIITCPPGQCATNIQSGFKTCPIHSQDSIGIDPTQSVCNSSFICDNPLTPYAVQSDGSTNINGICEPNTQCSCLTVSQCSNYTLSAFTSSNGNLYQPLSGQRITFPQISNYTNSNNAVIDIPPIQFNNPATTFCTASLDWLPLSNPGCNFVSTANNITMSEQELLLCMGMQNVNGCSGLYGAPCLRGVLALITNNPDEVNSNTLIYHQYGCVRGTPCPCGEITIFDTNYGGIICKKL